MLELSEDHKISMSKILTEVTAGDSLYCRRFLFSALSVLNPLALDAELECELDTCKLWAAKNRAKFSGMTDQDIAYNEVEITIAAIERYYTINPDKLTFVIAYESFLKLWANSEDSIKKENYKKTLLKAAESSTAMRFGRTVKVMTGNKVVKITKSVAVFQSIEVIGLQKLEIQLNPAFMPYIVLLNQVFKGYTSFPIRYLVGKNTVSSLMMSALALRFFRVGGDVSQLCEFDIPFLRHLLGCEQKYPVYKDFRKYIIAKGIAGINEDKAGGFTMEIFDEKRSGRVVTHIKFKITSESLSKQAQKSEKQKQFLKSINTPPQAETAKAEPPVEFESEEAINAQKTHLELLKKLTNQNKTI